MVQSILPYFQLATTCGTFLIMLYTLCKYVNKPRMDLEKRVVALEVNFKEIEQQLKKGNDKFRSHENILEVLVTCTLALINFEVHYCESEHKDISQDLADARKELNKCLSKISKEDNT